MIVVHAQQSLKQHKKKQKVATHTTSNMVEKAQDTSNFVKVLAKRVHYSWIQYYRRMYPRISTEKRFYYTNYTLTFRQQYRCLHQSKHYN